MKKLPVPTAIFRSKGWPLRKTTYKSRTKERAEAEKRGEQRSSVRIRGRGPDPVANRSRHRSFVQVRYHAADPPIKPGILSLSQPRKMAKAEESGEQRSSAPPQLTPPIRATLQFGRQRAKAAERDASKSSPLLHYQGRQPLRKSHPRLVLSRRKIAKVAEASSLLSKIRRIAKAEGRSPPRVSFLTRPQSWSLLSNPLSRSVGSSFQLHGFN